MEITADAAKNFLAPFIRYKVSLRIMANWLLPVQRKWSSKKLDTSPKNDRTCTAQTSRKDGPPFFRDTFNFNNMFSRRSGYSSRFFKKWNSFFLSDTDRVGVDVMRMSDKFPRKNIPEFFHLMKRQFTPEEWNTIHGQQEEEEEEEQKEQQLARFYRLWCLKESFVKADGSGLNWDLQRLSFQVRCVSQTSLGHIKETDYLAFLCLCSVVLYFLWSCLI